MTVQVKVGLAVVASNTQDVGVEAEVVGEEDRDHTEFIGPVAVEEEDVGEIVEEAMTPKHLQLQEMADVQYHVGFCQV